MHCQHFSFNAHHSQYKRPKLAMVVICVFQLMPDFSCTVFMQKAFHCQGSLKLDKVRRRNSLLSSDYFYTLFFLLLSSNNYHNFVVFSPASVDHNCVLQTQKLSDPVSSSPPSILSQRIKRTIERDQEQQCTKIVLRIV
ncbi:hypothetical protein QQ045_021472 [Rhodiola kirilowii]